MFISKIIDWINNFGDTVSDYILNPFLNLPGFLKFLVVLAIPFLSVVGLIRVARKALKTVVGIACAFIVLLIVWIIFFR